MSRASKTTVKTATGVKRLPFAKTAGRKPSKGATRNRSQAKPPNVASPWLSRLLIATAAGGGAGGWL